VELTYQSGGTDEVTRRTVSPYGMIFDDGTWYLVGYCHLRDDLRMFGVSRLTDLATTDWRYEVPKDFDLSAYLHKRWAQGLEARMRQSAPAVLVKVTKDAFGWLRHHWLYRHAATEETSRWLDGHHTSQRPA